MKQIRLILAAALLLAGMTVFSQQQQIGTSNTYWELVINGTDTTLEITGSGDMPDFEFESDIPWLLNTASITSAVIANGITGIGDGAFAYCKNLDSVSIPNSVTKIGYGAFSECSSLTSVTIPNSVTFIYEATFYSCSSLTSITIPNLVTVIGYNAFENCSGLTSVIIGNSVERIKEYAFAGCNNLTSVTIPNSVTDIEKRAFYSCSGLTSITCLASTPPTLGTEVFKYVPKSIPVCVPADKVTDYRSSDWGSHFTNISSCLPEPVSFTPDRNAINVSLNTEVSVTFDRNITAGNLFGITINGAAATASISGDKLIISHADFIALTSYTVNIPAGAVKDYASAISWSFTTESDSCTFGGYCGGEGDSTNLTWKLTCDGVLTISGSGKMADYVLSTPWSNHYSSITKIVIGNSVTSIGSGAFMGCNNATSVSIPNSVTFIGNSAFIGCTGLTSINIPNSVTVIESATFAICTGLTQISIPNSVKRIKTQAFFRCTGLTSVSIPNSVKNIGVSAFDDCTGIETLTIGNSVDSIQANAFENCSALTSVSIPNSVKHIGAGAFSYCKGMKTLRIGSSVDSIQFQAFDNCSALTSITCLAGTPPTLGWNVFLNVPDTVPVCVPAGSVADYRNDSRWSYFSNINGCAATTLSVSGRVTLEDGSPLAGVVISYGDSSVTTDTNGIYSVSVTNGDPITLTPEMEGYTFTPASITHNMVTAELTGQNFTAAPTVGITEISGENAAIKVYPNPTTGKVYLSVEGNIRVYSIRGALLHEAFGKEVDLSGYPQGVYFLKVDNKVTAKVVKE